MINGGPVGTADISFGKSTTQSIEAYIDEIKIFNQILSVSKSYNGTQIIRIDCSYFIS